MRWLAVVVLLDALFLAVGHAPLALGLSFMFRPPGPPPQFPTTRPPPTRAVFPFFLIGVYFLIAVIVYILGGILVVVRRLFKLANFGLIVLAVIDNVLLIYTRTMPNIFFGRVSGWSWSLLPPGTVEIFIGQAIIIVVCAILLYRPARVPRRESVMPK